MRKPKSSTQAALILAAAIIATVATASICKFRGRIELNTPLIQVVVESDGDGERQPSLPATQPVLPGEEIAKVVSPSLVG